MAALALATIALYATACSPITWGNDRDDVHRIALDVGSRHLSVTLAEQRADHRARHVDPRCPDHPVVAADDTGVATSQMLFDTSPAAVVADETAAAQLRAASVAVFAHVPMLTYREDERSALIAELERLGAQRIMLVGEVGIATSHGTPQVFADPGGLSALGDVTAHRFYPQMVPSALSMAAAVAALDGTTPTLLKAQWAEYPESVGETAAIPVLTRRDGGNSPVVVATNRTSVSSIATATAYGAEVIVVSEPDPRHSEQTLAAMIGLADRPLIALGADFAVRGGLAGAITEAEGNTNTSLNRSLPEF